MKTLTVFLFVILLVLINDLTLSQTANQLKLVINEIDYDQIGTDSEEWLEIAGVTTTSLTDILIVLINGANGTIYGEVNLDTYSIPNSTAKVTGGDGNEWDFFVVGASTITNVDYTPTGWGSDEIQNGSPDGILLAFDSNNNEKFDDGTDVVIDAVAYEPGTGGGNFATIFGTTRAPADNNNDAASSIGRDGNDLDTDDNSLDFNYSNANGSTPGNLNTNQNATSLPVELSSFSAVLLDNAVKLNWRTETEVNNYGFEVERRVGNRQSSAGNPPIGEAGWETIGFVEGHGNSNSPKEYSFTDNLSLTRTLSHTLTLHYRLKQIDNDGKFTYSKVIEVNPASPVKFELSQNYPNPFNPVTTIKYILPEAGNVKLKVFNLLGEEVKTLVNEFSEAGVYTVNFNSEGLNSGLYIYKLEANGFIQSRKMLLVK